MIGQSFKPDGQSTDKDRQKQVGKQRLQRISPFFIVLASFIIMAGLLEGASRLFYYIHWGGHLYGTQHNEYSLRLGWQLSPGSYRFFHVNQQAFRRPDDTSLLPPDNTIRIFLIGGSTAFGSNGLYPQIKSKPLYYEDTIDYQLQSLLTARHANMHFEVINAAVPEYRLFQEITLFREKLINFHPHLVIFLDGHNDISAVTAGRDLQMDPDPYWKSRHFLRGQRVLNGSGILGPFYYLDIYLGRSSYFYYGLTVLHQRLHEAMASQMQSFSVNSQQWGDETFNPSNEKSLRMKYEGKLKEYEEALPFYLGLIDDLKAIAGARDVNIVYALQPQIVIEEPTALSASDRQIQQIAFGHQRDLGTLAWRYLEPRIAQHLTRLNDRKFKFVNLVSIAGPYPDQLYTDYCHLTAEGNRIVAQRLYEAVSRMLGLESAHSVTDPVAPLAGLGRMNKSS